ncbi:hypothetical protein ACIPSA_07350 [Streptomyces sp. NPDC086549]|uniref:hypothetical protein n=1 Tax=Streptomyces sp. NPDC086549 TaxID=3365752 RepID=UPI003807641B
MPFSRRARTARIARTAVTVTLLAATAAACGDTGGLRGAGATPTAVSPVKLWPDLRPASSPAYDYDEGTTEVVKGVTSPGEDIHEDIHKVDPVAVVRAEMAAHPDDYGPNGAYHETAVRMDECGKGGNRGRCPLLKAYYRDLTGDGRDDLTLGFRLFPTNQTAVRVYTFEADRLVQVMADNDAIIGVELAGRAVIVRSPAGITGYEYRTTWEWDQNQLAMVFTRDEFLRTGRLKKSPASSARPSAASARPSAASVSPSTSSARPSASPSASAR